MSCTLHSVVQEHRYALARPEGQLSDLEQSLVRPMLLAHADLSDPAPGRVDPLMAAVCQALTVRVAAILCGLDSSCISTCS